MAPFQPTDFLEIFNIISSMAYWQCIMIKGLIPFKTLAFDTGINYTAGLPIIRTSPDHGTAYNIAGKNVADPSSFLQALLVANDVIKMRKEHHLEITI